MRIRSVRFANLNSLYGQWMIDFTDVRFVRDGLFAITGPTGSGKSTILDAICLALYGRTPRLDAIGGQANEIMSRQRGECFSEVIFETGKGVFRVLWAQHRARKRPDGNLAESTHEFADIVSRTILATRKREVAKAVEEATGMTFERFTRSMMLAQGQFAAFLNADADQRSPILEQITGTEIYSDISRRVHVATTQQRGALELLEREAEDAKPLAEHELFSLRERQRVQRLWLGTADRRSAALHTARLALAALQENERQAKQLETSLGTLESHAQEIESARSTLRIAERARDIEPVHAELGQRRQRVKQEKAACASLEERLPEASHLYAQAVLAHDEASLHLCTSRSDIQATLKLLERARALDRRIGETQSEADEARRQLLDALKTNRTLLASLSAAESELDLQHHTVEGHACWLAEHQGDASLEEVLATLRPVVGAFVAKERERELVARQLADLDTRLREASKSQDATKDACDAAATRRQKIVDEIGLISASMAQLLEGRLVRELEAERDHLQEKRTLLAAISSLEHHREHLAEGSPCPLCGSTEHPYLTEAIPVDDGLGERLRQIGQMLANHANMGSEMEHERQRLVAQELESAQLATRLEELGTRIGHLEHERASLDLTLVQLDGERARLDRLIEEAADGIDCPEGSWTEKLEHLEARLRTWKLKSRHAQEALQRSDKLEHEVQRQRDRRGLAAESIRTARARLDNLRHRSRTDESERHQLFGCEDPDEREHALSKALEHAELQVRLSEETRRRREREVDSIKDAIASSRRRIEEESVLLAEEDLRFVAALADAGFESEQAFLAARLGQHERERLGLEVQEHDRQVELVQRQLLAARAEHGILLDSAPAGWTMDSLEEESKELESTKRELYRSLGAIDERIASDAQQRQRHAAQLANIAAQRTQLSRWEQLDNLIGSHDGKKFRNYAQHLTFELLIDHANEHLRDLSERYVLASDPQRPLEFSVLDLYQGGEVRSARNLSGGESFLVSLALSLGLSTIASKKVQVDSLFLDEGFGSLDEQALETALSALSSLRGRGKLVGIISHVGALQERIPVQIRVTPLSGGMSRIDGPGCSRLDQAVGG